MLPCSRQRLTWAENNWVVHTALKACSSRTTFYAEPVLRISWKIDLPTYHSMLFVTLFTIVNYICFVLFLVLRLFLLCTILALFECKIYFFTWLFTDYEEKGNCWKQATLLYKEIIVLSLNPEQFILIFITAVF